MRDALRHYRSFGWRGLWRRYLGFVPLQFCMVCGRAYWGGMPRLWFVRRADGFYRPSWARRWKWEIGWQWLPWWKDFCSRTCANIDDRIAV